VHVAVAGLLVAPASASAVVVDAATSLARAFPQIDARPVYDFAGSDALVTQIRAGAAADVFAAASPKYADELYAAGTCSKPVTFATNLLVLVVPKSNPAGIRSVTDLARGPVRKLAVGQASVPVGAYTRKLLGTMHLDMLLTRNVVSDEPNVGAIVSAVSLGAADAGFVYVTDWYSNRATLAAVPLPAAAQPPVRYQMCGVLRSGADASAAARFMRKVLGPTGRWVLRRHGFGVPPL
jgi:molybdate transport system substrate-binding protein